jgi:hypothetical protein
VGYLAELQVCRLAESQAVYLVESQALTAWGSAFIYTSRRPDAMREIVFIWYYYDELNNITYI